MISYYPYQNSINKRHIGKNNCPLTRLSVISEIVNFCKYISHLLNFDTANMVVFDTKYLLVGVGNGFAKDVAKGLGFRKRNNLWHFKWLIFYLQIYYLSRFFYLDKNRREWEESNSLYFFHNSQMGISLLLLDCLCNIFCSLSRHITVMYSFFQDFFLNSFLFTPFSIFGRWQMIGNLTETISNQKLNPKAPFED